MPIKIAAVSVAKDESHNAEGWMQDMAPCDEIIVLDSGSSDDTREKLAALGAKVIDHPYEIWDGADARNRALAQVSDDVDWIVTTDFDERFEGDWRGQLEQVIAEDTDATLVQCWHRNMSEGSATEGTIWHQPKNKIYRRGYHIWSSPLHEDLVPHGPGPHRSITSDLVLQHHHRPGDQAAKREKYLDLCLHWVEVLPDDMNILWHLLQDARNMGLQDIVRRYAPLYIQRGPRDTDTRSLAMRMLAESLHGTNAPMDMIRDLMIKSYLEFPDQFSATELMRFAMSCDQPELALFATTLFRRTAEMESLRRDLIQRLSTQI